MKILLGDFDTKLGREDISKREIWNENQHQDNKDNGVRRVNFATTKIYLRAQCSRAETFINTHGPLLMRRLTTTLITCW